LALVLQVLIARGGAGRLLCAALELFGLVLELILDPHGPLLDYRLASFVRETAPVTAPGGRSSMRHRRRFLLVGSVPSSRRIYFCRIASCTASSRVIGHRFATGLPPAGRGDRGEHALGCRPNMFCAVGHEGPDHPSGSHRSDGKTTDAAGPISHEPPRAVAGQAATACSTCRAPASRRSSLSIASAPACCSVLPVNTPPSI